MSASLLISWRDGVKATAVGDGTLVVQGPGTRLTLRQVPTSTLPILIGLDAPGFDLERLGHGLPATNPGALAHCHYYLERLTQRGLIRHQVCLGETCLATLVAVSPTFVSKPDRVDLERCYGLSRFAFLRRQGKEAVLESPLSHARIVLNDCRAAALVGLLATPATAVKLAERLTSLDVAAVRKVLSLFLRAGMLAESTEEEDDPSLSPWEFHDLLFHSRVRVGRSDRPYGGTYRFVGRMPSPPALKSQMAGEIHDLYRPELERLERNDQPLTWVQSHRRSIREFDTTRPITAQQLGEFLFRVARVTEIRSQQVETSHGTIEQEYAARPYPSGGGLYELELYLAIQNCDHLPTGLYHYDSVGHKLIRLCGLTTETVELLHDAAQSTSTPPDTLQVLVLLATRFPRLAWKYESIAYSLTLKHVGVLYQTMYLVATAMGLAPCAVGGGNADLFARATGLAYSTETSVGEFLLGNPRPRRVDGVVRTDEPEHSFGLNTNGG